MAGMNDGDGEAGFSGLFEQPGFDGGFSDAVVAKRMARLVLGGGHGAAVAMDPDGSAMEQMRGTSAKGIDQLFGALRVIAG